MVSKNTVLVLVLVATVVISGCTNLGITDFIKTIPDVQSFLSQNPGAEIKAVFLSQNAVKANMQSIREDCGQQMEEVPYYHINITQDSQRIEVYLNESGNQVLCLIKLIANMTYAASYYNTTEKATTDTINTQTIQASTINQIIADVDSGSILSFVNQNNGTLTVQYKSGYSGTNYVITDEYKIIKNIINRLNQGELHLNLNITALNYDGTLSKTSYLKWQDAMKIQNFQMTYDEWENRLEDTSKQLTIIVPQIQPTIQACEILESSKRDTCYFNEAVYRKDKRLCENVIGLKDGCYWNYVIWADTSDLSACKKIANGKLFDLCSNFVANTCEKVTDKSFFDLCNLYIKLTDRNKSTFPNSTTATTNTTTTTQPTTTASPYVLGCQNFSIVDLSSHYNQIIAGNFSFTLNGCRIEMPSGAIIVTECQHPTYFTQSYISNYSVQLDDIVASEMYVLWDVSFPGCREMPYFHWDWGNYHYNETVGKIIIHYTDGSSGSFDMRWRKNVDDTTCAYCRNVPEATKIFSTPKDCDYLVKFNLSPIPVDSVEFQVRQNVYPAGEIMARYRSIIFQTGTPNANNYAVSDLSNSCS